MPSPKVPKYTRLPVDEAAWIDRYAAEHHLSVAVAFALVVRAGIDALITQEQTKTPERTA